MRKQPKKLALRHDTIRQLSTVEIAQAHGGESEATCQPTTQAAFDTGLTTCVGNTR